MQESWGLWHEGAERDLEPGGKDTGKDRHLPFGDMPDKWENALSRWQTHGQHFMPPCSFLLGTAILSPTHFLRHFSLSSSWPKKAWSGICSSAGLVLLASPMAAEDVEMRCVRGQLQKSLRKHYIKNEAGTGQMEQDSDLAQEKKAGQSL